MALLLLGKYRRDSSVGRASDWRSEGPWFNPGSRQFFFTALSIMNFTCIVHSVATASHDRNILIVKSLKVKTRPRWDSNPQSSDSKSDALSIRPRGHTDYFTYWQLRLIIFNLQLQKSSFTWVIEPWFNTEIFHWRIEGDKATYSSHKKVYHIFLFYFIFLLYDNMIRSYY